MIIPVILCGGSGTRLWPCSRQAYPKQLLTLSSSISLLQETIKRTLCFDKLKDPMIICNIEHRFSIAEQLTQINFLYTRLILEPESKNTAPAVAVAAELVDKDDLLLVLPADHKIENVDAFINAVLQAESAAQAGSLVVFGVEPRSAETAYGYIKQGRFMQNMNCFAVEKFMEKPDLNRAKEYFSSPGYFWNSGMFLFKASSFLEQLKNFHPSIVSYSKASIEKARDDKDFFFLDKKNFNNCENISIDYAVMEKAKNISLVPLQNSGWSDLGSWNAIYDISKKDENNNVIQGDVCVDSVKNCYLQADNRLLAVVGVSDHIIIETADAVLVAHKESSQDVKKIVAQLKESKRPEIDFHQKVFRPWGYYEVLEDAEHVKVKRIVVKPKLSLSLQLHHYRSEHWIIVQGIAEVTCGEKIFQLKQNQSTYIPANHKHRLKNPINEVLILIEVQTGEYLGEDDIVRFADDYGRITETAV